MRRVFRFGPKPDKLKLKLSQKLAAHVEFAAHSCISDAKYVSVLCAILKVMLELCSGSYVRNDTVNPGLK